jgi:ribosomal protein L11 methyltransferase
MAGRVAARAGSLPSGGGPWDLVLANLIASLLVTLAPQLAAEVGPGGTIVASGIFVDREPEVSTALAQEGLHVVDRSSEGDWVALVARRSAGPVAGP